MAKGQIKLFDDLLAVLDKHRTEPGVEQSIEDLRAAKINYSQDSTEQLVACLILAVRDLNALPAGSGLWAEIKTTIDRFAASTLKIGSKLSDLAQQYETSGGKLLSYEEILREVDERRGVSR
jgi:hypothetical protein